LFRDDLKDLPESGNLQKIAGNAKIGLFRGDVIEEI